MGAATIVLAEDEAPIRELLKHHLQRERFTVVEAPDGALALRAARAVAHLVVVDIGLPVVDGYEVVRILRRERRSVPVIMLTARAEEIDRVIGFEAGADDYVCKPFSPHEIIARIRAVLRRVNPASLESNHRKIVLDRLVVDEASREAHVDGELLALRPREFTLLLELVSNCNIALSREQLLDRVWGVDYGGETRTVDSHMSRLRTILEQHYALPLKITTLQGYGYKFATSQRAAS